MQQEEIIICADNKYIIKEHYNEVNKESDCTKEAGRIVKAIRREIKSIRHEVRLKYSNTKINLQNEFSQLPSPMLMKRCNEKSKEDQRKLQHEEVHPNAVSKGEVVPIVEGKCGIRI